METKYLSPEPENLFFAVTGWLSDYEKVTYLRTWGRCHNRIGFVFIKKKKKKDSIFLVNDVLASIWLSIYTPSS